MTPQEVYERCKKEKRRIIDLEKIITVDPKLSYLYAREIIKGFFEKGEESISKYAVWSYYYARDVIKGSFKKGEDAISKDSYYSYHYAVRIIGPFEKCHPYIFNSIYKESYINFLRSTNYDYSEWLI